MRKTSKSLQNPRHLNLNIFPQLIENKIRNHLMHSFSFHLNKMTTENLL